MAPTTTMLPTGLARCRVTTPVFPKKFLCWDRRADVVRIVDRPLGIDAKTFRNGGVVHEGILQGVSNVGVGDTAAVPGGHRLQVHVFLVVGAVAVHDIEQRNAVMRGRP